jgi:hypothetical protein
MRDNVFVERLWRSIKYEEVYVRAYDGVGEARILIGRYPDFYNRRQRLHLSKRKSIQTTGTTSQPMQSAAVKSKPPYGHDEHVEAGEKGRRSGITSAHPAGTSTKRDSLTPTKFDP